MDGWLHCVASNGAKGLVPSSYVRLLGAGEHARPAAAALQCGEACMPLQLHTASCAGCGAIPSSPCGLIDNMPCLPSMYRLAGLPNMYSITVQSTHAINNSTQQQ